MKELPRWGFVFSALMVAFLLFGDGEPPKSPLRIVASGPLVGIWLRLPGKACIGAWSQKNEISAGFWKDLYNRPCCDLAVSWQNGEVLFQNFMDEADAP